MLWEHVGEAQDLYFRKITVMWRMDLVQQFISRILKDTLFSPSVYKNYLGRNGQNEWEFAVNVATFYRKLSVQNMDKNDM